uniref:B box-type domain-containing protein n=1 Tax=Zea mays TaxID=4577 RepID=A0A804NU04_MAIZE
MKVQCDVCAAEAAEVFCCADEAALCDACDRRVHRANKLAGKHRRFSLLSPAPPPPPPLCDICQDKRGLLFCKEDRAILCRDCDVSVHTASDLTMRHARFLLTGVRLSAEPAAACPAPEDEEEEDDENSSGSFCCSAGDAAAHPPPLPSSAPATSHGSDSSSISEYLTKTLPGWHVEDFLVDEAAAAAATDIGVSAADASYQEQHHLGLVWKGSGSSGNGSGSNSSKRVAPLQEQMLFANRLVKNGSLCMLCSSFDYLKSLQCSLLSAVLVGAGREPQIRGSGSLVSFSSCSRLRAIFVDTFGRAPSGSQSRSCGGAVPNGPLIF